MVPFFVLMAVLHPIAVVLAWIALRQARRSPMTLVGTAPPVMVSAASTIEIAMPPPSDKPPEMAAPTASASVSLRVCASTSTLPPAVSVKPAVSSAPAPFETMVRDYIVTVRKLGDEVGIKAE